MANVRKNKEFEGRLLQRYGQKNQVTEKTLETDWSETKDSGMKDTAERDKDMLRTGLVQA